MAASATAALSDAALSDAALSGAAFPRVRRPKALLPLALLAALAVVSPALATTAEAEPDAPLTLERVRGGAIEADAVFDGRRLYLPTGRTVSVWDYADPDAAVQLGTAAPAGGPLAGLVRVGDHLYGVWRSYSDRTGVAVWSLHDPDAPELVGDGPYTGSDFPFANGLVAANGTLYLFDGNEGVLVGDLSDPQAPRFTATGLPASSQYRTIVAYGDRIHAVGRTLDGRTTLEIYDVSAPTAPFLIARHVRNGTDDFTMVPGGDRVAGVGNRLTFYDLEDPTVLLPLGQTPIPPAIAGAWAGAEHVYTFGYGEGLDIWSVADPAAPAAAGHLDLRTLGARRSIGLGDDGLLIPTSVDLLQFVDTSRADAPRHGASHVLPGVSPADVAEHDGRLVVLQADYGLTVNDPRTLAPIARFEADLPESLQARVFEQMHIHGDIAWLAAWGYGLIAVDLAGGTPREVGRLEFPFASVIAIEGDLAYVAKNTNGPLFGVVDIADPANPRLVWQAALGGRPYRLAVHDGHAYLAGTPAGADGVAGLQVWSLADPAAPAPLAFISEDCGDALDLGIDHEVNLLYLACNNALQVIDIADPAAPRLVGRHDLEGYNSEAVVAQHLDRAWYGHNGGIQQFDVSDPTRPRPMGAPASIGGEPARRLQRLDDGRLAAIGARSGLHLFAVDEDGGSQPPVPLHNRVPVGGLEGTAGSERVFTIEISEDTPTPSLSVLSYGGRGDVRLQLRHGAPPTDAAHDAASDRPGNNETIRITEPQTGTWYLRVQGVADYADLSVLARW